MAAAHVVFPVGLPELRQSHPASLPQAGFQHLVLELADLLADGGAESFELFKGYVGPYNRNLQPGLATVGSGADLHLPA